MRDENFRMTSSRGGGETTMTHYTHIDGQLDDIDGVCRSVLDSGIDSMRSSEFEGIGDICYSENRSDSLCGRFESASIAGQCSNINDGADPNCDFQTPEAEPSPTDQGFEDADQELEEEISLESVIDASSQHAPCSGDFTHDELVLQDEDGDTQLHIAIIQRNTSITFKLIEKVFRGDLLDIHNDMNQTALHLAVITNQPDVVNKLMMSGANPQIRDRNGNTPLHLAATQGNIDCVTELIKSCRCIYSHYPREVTAFINLFNYAGHTSLHEAGLVGHVDIVECLLRCGADINTPDGTSGRTLLHHAVERNNIAIVKLLCDWPRANIDQPTWSGSTPYQMAAERGFTEVAEILKAAGADVATTLCMESDGLDSSMDDITEEFTDFVINGQPL